MKPIPQEVAEEMLASLIEKEYDCENETTDRHGKVRPCWRSRLICEALQVNPAVQVFPVELRGEMASEVKKAMEQE